MIILTYIPMIYKAIIMLIIFPALMAVLFHEENSKKKIYKFSALVIITIALSVWVGYQTNKLNNNLVQNSKERKIEYINEYNLLISKKNTMNDYDFYLKARKLLEKMETHNSSTVKGHDETKIDKKLILDLNSKISKLQKFEKNKYTQESEKDKNKFLMKIIPILIIILLIVLTIIKTVKWILL